jgi:hypothetical protein
VAEQELQDSELGRHPSLRMIQGFFFLYELGPSFVAEQEKHEQGHCRYPQEIGWIFSEECFDEGSCLQRLFLWWLETDHDDL